MVIGTSPECTALPRFHKPRRYKEYINSKKKQVGIQGEKNKKEQNLD